MDNDGRLLWDADEEAPLIPLEERDDLSAEDLCQVGAVDLVDEDDVVAVGMRRRAAHTRLKTPSSRPARSSRSVVDSGGSLR